MKKLLAFVTLIFSIISTAPHASAESAVTTAQAEVFVSNTPRIAVYVTGNAHPEQKTALSTHVFTSLINSGRYRGIERSKAFLAELEKEMQKQRSGEVDDSQISALGRQFGVGYICVVDATLVTEKFHVSARIIDVETAEVKHIGNAYSSLRSTWTLKWTAHEVVRKMFGSVPPHEKYPSSPSGGRSRKKSGDGLLPVPAFKMSLGIGGTLAVDNGGGVKLSGAEGQIIMPGTFGGVYAFADVTYAEIFAGFSVGGGKWISASVDDGLLPEMSRQSLIFGLYAKYPLPVTTGGGLHLFPLAGAEYELSISGQLKHPDGALVDFDGGKEPDGTPRPNKNALSAAWLKIGAGADFDLNKRVYLRVAYLYGIRMENGFEKLYIDNYIKKAGLGNADSRLGHGMTLRGGAGIRF